tara:strand:+ start:631 stop:846 length:216 start_codon:yes stop_codon:yes gene_type:complete
MYPYNHFGLRQLNIGTPPRRGMSNLTETQRRKLMTRAEVPAADLNEWGYPASPKYAFRGFVAGAARWEVVQ